MTFSDPKERMVQSMVGGVCMAEVNLLAKNMQLVTAQWRLKESVLFSGVAFSSPILLLCIQTFRTIAPPTPVSARAVLHIVRWLPPAAPGKIPLTPS